MGRMNEWLGKPNVLKVIALVLGVLLWFAVQTDEKTTPGSALPTERENTITNVKVTPIYDSETYHIQSIDPAEVMIKVKGKDTALKKVNTATYRIVLDLTNAKVGENTLPLTPEKFPNGVEVSIYPPYAKVVLEGKQQKEMPVTANVTGNPVNGYKAGQPVIRPMRVIVTAPSSLIDSVASVRADVSVESASSAVTKQVKLVAYDKNGKPLDVSMNPQVVDVEVPITQPFKKMPLRIKTTGSPLAGYSVASFTPSAEQITVYGPQELLNTLEFYEGPSVDLTGLKESKTFTLDIPLRNKVTTLDPPKVDVKVEIVPSTTRAFDQVPLTIVGQNDMYDTKITSPTNGVVSFTLEGAPAVLDKLKVTDVQAIVDVSNLPPGKHDVPVSVNVSPFVRRTGADLRAMVEISAKPGAGGAGGGAAPANAGVSGGTSASPTPSGGPAGPSGTATPAPTPTPQPTPQPTPTGSAGAGSGGRSGGAG
ncbi:YbbR-like domain-containing protein [Paenibacillus sp. HJGM_3]|uniref:CdaR family protein n=1 Tax=Paenibacillus sp. HJGM_3 TaxID=3379816 RepID=UPI0038595AFF